METQTVPAEVQDQVLGMTHGYPLALSLVAENFAQTGSVGLGPDPSLDLVTVLLDRFLEGVEEPLQRELLELCALVRMVTEPLIAEVVDAKQAAPLFAWLKSLSFIEATAFGLMPHDLARDAIATELRWRNPEKYSELHHRARRYYSERLDRATGPTQQYILFDYIYLHRDNPMMAPFFQWNALTSAFSDSATAADLPEILRIVERHEGQASSEWAQFWFQRQPDAFLLVRDSLRPANLKGLIVALNLAAAGDDVRQDPATNPAMAHIEQTAPMRAGERATYFRFWMTDDGYQAVNPIQSLIFVSVVQHYLTTPALSFTFLPCADPDFWAPMFQYAGHPLVPSLGFEVEGSRMGRMPPTGACCNPSRGSSC